MSYLRTILTEPVIEAFGWTLFHSVWQIAAIAAVMFVFLFFLKNKSSNSRYLISTLALITIVITSMVTFSNSFSYAVEKEQLKTLMLEDPTFLKTYLNNSLNQQSNIGKIDEVNLKKVQFRGFMQRHYHIIFFTWFVGIALLLIKMLSGIIYLDRLKSTRIKPVSDEIKEITQVYLHKLGVNRTVKIFESSLAKLPLVIGHIKPVILLPVKIITGLSQKEIEAIIAHELAHIKRYDYLINILQSLIETVFFYHPAAWLISRIIRTERESACDELALKLTKDKVNYLKALTNTEIISNNRYSTLQMAFSDGRGSLLKRAIRIQKLNTMKKNVTEGFIAATIVFFSLILVSFSFDGQNLKSTNSDDSASPLENKPTPYSFVHKNDDNLRKDTLTEVRMKKIEELENIPEEIAPLIELAYTHENTDLSNQITESISLAMAEINMEKIMCEVDSAIKAANINEEIYVALAEARSELVEANNDSLLIAIEALELAHETIEAIDVENIVSMALEQAAVAIEAIDFESIMEDAMQQASEAMREIDLDQIMEDAMNDIEIDHYQHDYEEEYKEIEEEFRTSVSERKSERKRSASESSERSSSQNNRDQKEKELEQKLRDIED